MRANRLRLHSNDTGHSGFTLTELLVVLVIIGLTVGVVAPQGYKVFDGARRYIARLEDAGFKKKAVFQAFIQDSDCEVAYRDSKVALICEDQVVLTQRSSEKLQEIFISNKGFQ